MTAITSIHDKFIRAILADTEIAISYFKACLPENIADLLDWSTLTQLSDTYISKELREKISDIVYGCRRKDSTRKVKISILFEHKSKPEKFTPVQLLNYLSSGFQKQAAQDKEVSPIIPILLYHGKERWRYRTLATLFNAPDQELRPFIPEYDYIYHDLGEISDEDIQLLENKFLRASFLALKYSQLKAELVKWIPTILALSAEATENLQTSLFVYTFEVSELEEDQIIRLSEEVPANIKNTVMSTADVFIEKGKREKTEKGVRNMILRNYSDKEICEVQEVTPDYVARIRKELADKE
ncbi:MAG: hypothetical protein ABS46_11250 [Cytophagaceae bacterium SCN 52-12]|nr:MAG: hypothetical protein ABS46_11250 [Cytophagaceae bacterium SCN 52-12]